MRESTATKLKHGQFLVTHLRSHTQSTLQYKTAPYSHKSCYQSKSENASVSLRWIKGPAVHALRRAIAEVKQRWSLIGWVTKNLLSRAPPCFERHVNLLVPATFAVVSTHQPTLGLRTGLWPVLLMCNP
jgi:hypothetical protein